MTEDRGNIAIVTARGGSKRIPGKNLRSFAGKPIIAWPISTALECGLFDHVLVSTDDEQIARIASDLGAEVPFMRPAGLAGDHTPTVDVVSHAVNWAAQQGWLFDGACCLYGTSAFATANDLVEARGQLGSRDYVFAAGRFAKPPQRAFIRQENGAMRLLQPQFAMTRTQDLEPAYYDAGQFYWGSAEAWIERRPIFGDRTSFIVLPPERAIDIDTPDDWAMAERQFIEWKRSRG